MIDPEIYEWQEYVDTHPNAQKWPLTESNLKDMKKYERRRFDALWAKYTQGGVSPPKTYLQIAQRYGDVDSGYGSFINE